MIHVKSVRVGHANNSSSSHSIILLKKEDYDSTADIESNDTYNFGWDEFVLKSESEKNIYLSAIIKEVIDRLVESTWDEDPESILNKVKAFVALNYDIHNLNEYFAPLDIERAFLENASVDHQSKLYEIPNDEKGNPNFEFLRDICKAILKENFVIVGGNDNSDSSELKNSLESKGVETHLTKMIKSFWR